MVSHHFQSLLVFLVVTLATFQLVPTYAQSKLSPDFYRRICPRALPTIRSVVKRAIQREPRMGASLLRLHFHDCFVKGCDGSVLLDDFPGFIGEKTARPNNNSARGFEVVDEIKRAVDKACKKTVVSCADILAVAARDSVEILGGRRFRYQVELGRRDARTASRDAANTNLPLASFNFSQLLSNFQSQGLSLKDLVVLSGGHTIGLARCATFRTRLYNGTNIDQSFADTLKRTCPASGGDSNLSPFDSTPNRTDTVYYTELGRNRGLLRSDQELFKRDGGESDRLVQLYSRNLSAFAIDFGVSMIKMGNIRPLPGTDLEIRINCRKIN